MITKRVREEQTECADCKIAELERAVAAEKMAVKDAVHKLTAALVESGQVKDLLHAQSIRDVDAMIDEDRQHGA